MDLYIWIMRQKGFAVEDIGYFLYCDGDRFTKTPFLGKEKAVMEFKMTLIPYQCDLRWIEPILFQIKKVLTSQICPPHSKSCEYGHFLKRISED